MKVFVLVIDYAFDYEQSIDCEAFEKLSYAQQAMRKLADSFERDNPGLYGAETKRDEEEHSLCIYRDGDYTQDHMSLTIFEKDTDPGFFQLPDMSVSRGDFDGMGHNMNKVDDEQMEQIASSMSESIIEYGCDWHTAKESAVESVLGVEDD